VLSSPPVPGWQTIAALGNTAPQDWPATTPAQRAQAESAMAAYLRNMRFENVTINGCYLHALGLNDASRPEGLPCTSHPAP
jgi:hypothetical protein